LDKLLSLALKQNPTLQARRNQTLAEEDAYKALRKLPNPSIALEKGRGESFDGDISRDIQGLTLSQVIKNPVSWHFRVEAAEKGWQAASELYRLTELELICQIKQKCYSIWLLRNKRNLSEKKTASIKQMSQLIRKRAELGEVKPLDALKLQVEFLLARNELKEMETELQIARDQLNEFLGGLLPSEFTIKGDLKFFPSLLEENQMVNKALLAHPLIKEKESRVAQIENHLAAEKWSRLPDLELSAFSRKELHGKISGFGLSLDLPLWNLKSKEISRAENLLQVEKKELEALRLNLISRVEAELRRLNLSEETILVFQEGLLKQAEASLDIAEISYQEGEISLLEFLDAQRTFYTILNDYQDALFRWNANRAALEKTIGEKLE
ncbi:MAG: TolC family protein, partial [Acidobacteriota bacterium]